MTSLPTFRMSSKSLSFTTQLSTDKLEEVSYLLKQNGKKIEDFLVLEEMHNYAHVSESLKAYFEKLNNAYYKVSNQ